MGVETTDIHMGLGACRVDLNWDAEVNEELTDPVTGDPLPVHLLFFDADDNLRDIRVLMTKKASAKGITLGGPNVDYWAGAGDIGPLIRLRKFISEQTLLTDGGFELNVVGEPFLYWSAPGETAWAAAVGIARGGSAGAAYVAGTPTADDVLVSTEGKSAEAGEQFILEMWLKRGPGTVGHIRGRLVFGGRFQHPNLYPTLASGDAWDLGTQASNNPTAATDAFEMSGGLLRGQTPFPIYQVVLNPLFADDYDFWFISDPHWHVDGSASPDMPTSIHYEGSGFITPDVVITNGSDVLTSATADWTLPTYTTPDATGLLVEGPGIPAYTYVVGVSGPGTLQISALATEDHLAGDTAVAFRPQTTSRTYFATDATNAGTTLSQYPVTKGETWSLYCHVMKTDNANGTATINFAKIKTGTSDHLAGLFLEQADSISTGGTLVLSTSPEPNVRVVTKQTTIEEETTHLGVLVELAGNTDGRWWFSNFLLQRVMGNLDGILGASWAVTPERTYTVTLPIYSSDLLVDEATARLILTMSGPDRAEDKVLTFEQKRTDGKQVYMVQQVTPPSGYTFITASLQIQDVFNDWFYFGEMTVVDADPSTAVFDVTSSDYDADWTGYQVSATAPDGTETAHAELVAEDQAYGWLADDIFWGRTGITPATIGDVIAALLTYPTSGLPLPVIPGTIHDAGDPIPHDFTITNMHCRAAREFFARSVCDPPREWRIDGPTREMHFGLSTQVFADRTDLVFLLTDLDVADLPPAEVSSVDLAADVLVIGADRPSTNPLTKPRQVSATAVNVTTAVDWDGNPLERTKLVEDSSVDHSLGAAALARQEADTNASPARSFTITLGGAREGVDTLGAGDWVYAYHHEAGIEDLTNPVEIEGRTVWPMQLRVLSVTRRPLNGRVAVRRLDGSSFDLPGVLWNDADEVVIELTTRQQGALLDRPRNPLLRLRAQSPR